MKLLNKLKDLIFKNKAKVTQGVDKATDVIDKRTGGKYSDQLDKVDRTVSTKIDELASDDVDLSKASADAKDSAADAVNDAEEKLES